MKPPTKKSGSTPSVSMRILKLPYRQARREWLDIFERQYLRHIMLKHDNCIEEAARYCEMSRNTIYRMMRDMD